MNDEKTSRPQKDGPIDDFVEKRRAERYHVPSVYQRYIKLQIKNNDVFLPVILHNFSRHGILFESPAPFNAGSRAACVISISSSLSKNISFGIQVKHCRKTEARYIIGAVIETVADETWFNIFVEVHDFIVQRRDVVY